MLPQIRRRRFALPDGEMAGLEAGDPDRPLHVIFLHANGFCASAYQRLLGDLSDRLRVLAIDQRGHGRSTLPAKPEGRDAWYEFGRDLIALVRQAAPARPVVVSGHSMGGTAAILATPELGGRVKGLVLLDPVIMRRRGETGAPSQPSQLIEGARRRRRDFESREAAVEAYVGRGAFRTWDRQAIADYVEDGFVERDGGVTLACTPEWEASSFAAQSTNIWPSLDAITVPISVFRAEVGSTCLLSETSPEIVGHPERRVLTVAGSTHFLPMERPDLVEQALLEACR